MQRALFINNFPALNFSFSLSYWVLVCPDIANKALKDFEKMPGSEQGNENPRLSQEARKADN